MVTALCPGLSLKQKQNFEVWKRSLVNGQYAVAVLNNRTDGAPRSFATTLSLLGISDCRAGYRLYDVLGKLSMGIYALNDTISAKVTPTGVLLLFLNPLC